MKNELAKILLIALLGMLLSIIGLIGFVNSLNEKQTELEKRIVVLEAEINIYGIE